MPLGSLPVLGTREMGSLATLPEEASPGNRPGPGSLGSKAGSRPREPGPGLPQSREQAARPSAPTVSQPRLGAASVHTSGPEELAGPRDQASRNRPREGAPVGGRGRARAVGGAPPAGVCPQGDARAFPRMPAHRGSLSIGFRSPAQTQAPALGPQAAGSASLRSAGWGQNGFLGLASPPRPRGVWVPGSWGPFPGWCCV